MHRRFEHLLSPSLSPLGEVRAVLALLCLITAFLHPTRAPARPLLFPPLTDSLYAAHHPRLLFSTGELDSLRTKLADGGDDDVAYAFIRLVADYLMPLSAPAQILGSDYGLNAVPLLAVATWIPSPMDTLSERIGRDAVLYLARTTEPDSDVYDSSLKLRSLAIGYDCFFLHATEAQRDTLREEITRYLDRFISDPNVQLYGYSPYMANKTAMLASSMGLAAIALADGEMGGRESYYLSESERLLQMWTDRMWDLDGSYFEGALYGSWALRHLCYYFEARRRYDGLDHAADPLWRKALEWFCYELLPEGGGYLNNIGDCSSTEFTLSKNNTFFEWALARWSDPLAAWVWNRTSGPYGHDTGLAADKAATVLWHLPVVETQPDSVLPGDMFWTQRGLYVYRTGWPAGGSSDDLLFTFYSGPFHGGHAQEDQNQITLEAFGERLLLDHGMGSTAKETEAHSLPLVDGRGQHNAGGSIGTDGAMRLAVLSPTADLLWGDATDAYTTHSRLNDPDFPFPGTDWSWGYDGGNPMERAWRWVVVMHDGFEAPSILVVDQLCKDSLVHDYTARFHLPASAAVDPAGWPIQATVSRATLDAFPLTPCAGWSTVPFDNDNAEPNSQVLTVTVTDTAAQFVVLFYPHAAGAPSPTVIPFEAPWGTAAWIGWPDGTEDLLLVNGSGSIVSTAQIAALHTTPGDGRPAANPLPVLETDAVVAVVRMRQGTVTQYVLAEATTATLDGLPLLRVEDGPLSVVFTGTAFYLNRLDAQFALLSLGATEVRVGQQILGVVLVGDTLFPDPAVGTPGAPVPSGRLSVYPNPFNPVVTIELVLPEPSPVAAEVVDVRGRRVRTFPSRRLPEGLHRWVWDGRDDRGVEVPSGFYWLRLQAGPRRWVRKLLCLR
jgi:hypothetical protein